MFTFRKITPNGLEHNLYLGKSYIYVDRETQYEEFCRAYKQVFEVDHVADLDEMSNDFSKNCYGVITYNDGFDLFPVYKQDLNYIMSSNGQTFAKI